MPSALSALAWTERLLALSLLLQTLEFVRIQAAFTGNGTWSWQFVRDDFEHLPPFARNALGSLCGDKGIFLVLAARALAAGALLAFSHPALLAFLICTTLLTNLRWRGIFNGGSDYMTFVVLLAALMASFASSIPMAAYAALWFIAVQSCLSYFLAGVAKLKSSAWRDGSALQLIVLESGFRLPRWLRPLVNKRALMSMTSWSVIVFELAFPLALTRPSFAITLIALGALFHLANAYTLGLNRFFWAWIATYPALLYCSIHH